MLVRQLEEELRIRSMQNPSLEMRQQVEAIYAENEHLTREVAILRETVKVNFVDFPWQFDVGHPKMKTFDTQALELMIETQQQTLQSRDESIKKLLEMLQNKGMGESRSFA